MTGVAFSPLRRKIRTTPWAPKAAEERNAENLLIIEDKIDLVRAYSRNFNEHLDHSVEYTGLGGGQKTEPPARDAKPAPDDDTDTITVHMTRTGSKYHRAGCRYLKSDIPIRLKKAKARGLEPCKVCKPQG